MSAPSTRAAGWDTALRTVAAMVGTLPVALLVAACLARYLPCSADLRYAAAFVVLIPTWIGGMCAAFLARSGARACVACLGVSVLLAMLL